jgi:capsular polysaccharide transport system permease protein
LIETNSIEGFMIEKIRQASRPLLDVLQDLFTNRLFLASTVLPTALAIIYFGLVASDVFVSESRFVIRSPEPSTASPLGLILKGAGFARAQDDSYTVQDFMLSRDALQALDKAASLLPEEGQRTTRIGLLDHDIDHSRIHGRTGLRH